MSISYISTRGGGQPQSFEQVLMNGLAPDGGLYVPETWPQIDSAALKGKSYTDIAEAVMYPFVEGSIPRDDFRSMIDETYDPKSFRHPEISPLKCLGENLHVLELFHGPTIAFKDVALQFLGRLFDYVLTKNNTRITIVGATSGDTGSAAIEGCYKSKHVDMFILFPDGRVSEVQRRQMTGVDAPNVHNIALDGRFDDCQTAVKTMFENEAFRTEINLSAVNSINWARIMAQIVYYFTASLSLDEPASFVVPTGNFGNIYAAYCARQMGLPIKTLAVSTNRNDILTRFFETAEMKITTVESSLSPSMDIQISSNFERYLFDVLGRDSDALQSLMGQFKATGHFVVPDNIIQKAVREFRAFRASDEETLSAIRDIHERYDYILDPHTAVGMKGALEIAAESGSPVVSLACAHPAKFPDAVEKAINIRPDLPDHLSDLFDRPESMTRLPSNVTQLMDFIRSQR